MYLAHNLPRCNLDSKRPSAIELGSGIGFTACVPFISAFTRTEMCASSLALSSLGWDVLATDIPHVIQSVLRSNVTNNLTALPSGSGNVQVRELDWSVHPDNWTWDHESIIASPSLSEPPSAPSSLHPSFDLIISADTVYAIELVNPFLRTLHALSLLSISSARGPPIFLCIERRDPMVVDRLLSDAQNEWGFVVERIPQKKVAKALEKSGVHWGKSNWEDIEIWKLRLLSL